TKKGKAGATRVDVNFFTGWSRIARKARMMNREEYLEMRREAFKNDGIVPDADNAIDLVRWDTTKYTDWQKELIGRSTRTYDAQISVSGGTSAVQYLVGGSYHRETSPFGNEFRDQKVSVHFSLSTTSMNQKFKMGLSGTLLSDKNQLPPKDATKDIFL